MSITKVQEVVRRRLPFLNHRKWALMFYFRDFWEKMIILREKKQEAGAEYGRQLCSGAATGQEPGQAWDCADGGMGCDRKEGSIGFALDIGTTTIAMTAVDLYNGRVIGKTSQTNRQAAWGADVVMRIMHAGAGKLSMLQQLVVEQVEEMAVCLLVGQGCDGRGCRFAVVGNTAMCHLFLGKPVDGLAGYPFESAYQGNYCCTGEELGMAVFREAEILVLSSIASHVGGDALAVIGARRLYDTKKVQLAIDLGTNAEIILNKKGRILVCSAAAGPAFEGKGVACGMRAAPGAVVGVKLAANTGNIILEYLAGSKPCGICGSGLADAVAELVKTGLLQEDGCLLERGQAGGNRLSERLMPRAGKRSFVFCGKEQAEREIYLDQEDIRSVQLAKGAIQAGVQSLLKEAGISMEEIDELVVAGALGSCLHPKNAVSIGLLPKVQLGRFQAVGNAAEDGAAKMLLDRGFAEEMEKLAGEICHVELANSEKFRQLMLDGMAFREYC